MADIEELLAALSQQDNAPAEQSAPEPTPNFDPFVPPADMPTASAQPQAQPTAPTSSPGGGSFRSDGSFAPYEWTADTNRGNAGLNKGASIMDNALGTVLALFGGERGDAPGAYYKPDPNAVIDYQRTGIDTSAMANGGLPVERVYNVRGQELGERPVKSWSSFGEAVPGRVQATDNQRKPLFNEDGSIQYANIPGYTSRFGRDLNPTTLENGQRVMYSANDNLTFGMKDGKPDMLLPGGIGYQGGGSGGAYGFVPTTMQGRDVWYDREGNRTFERNGDKIGRPLGGGLGSQADRPAYSGGNGGGGGGIGKFNAASGDVIVDGSLDKVGGKAMITNGNGWADEYIRAADGSVKPTGHRVAYDPAQLFAPGVIGKISGTPGVTSNQNVGKPVVVGPDGSVVINRNGAQMGGVMPGSTAHAVSDGNGQPIGTVITEPNGNTYVIAPDGTKRFGQGNGNLGGMTPNAGVPPTPTPTSGAMYPDGRSKQSPDVFLPPGVSADENGNLFDNAGKLVGRIQNGQAQLFSAAGSAANSGLNNAASGAYQNLDRGANYIGQGARNAAQAAQDFYRGAQKGRSGR